MKLLFLMCLIGAIVGGFPGGIVAFFFAASFNIGGKTAELICLIVNLLLSVGGAFIGMLLVKAIRGQERYQAIEIILPPILGLFCGAIAYIGLYWAVSHAEPPL